MEFPLGAKVVEIETGDIGIVVPHNEYTFTGNVNVQWETGSEAGNVLNIDPKSIRLASDAGVIINSKFKEKLKKIAIEMYIEDYTKFKALDAFIQANYQ
jgi:hypothetical protein